MKPEFKSIAWLIHKGYSKAIDHIKPAHYPIDTALYLRYLKGYYDKYGKVPSLAEIEYSLSIRKDSDDIMMIKKMHSDIASVNFEGINPEQLDDDLEKMIRVTESRHQMAEVAEVVIEDFTDKTRFVKVIDEVRKYADFSLHDSPIYDADNPGDDFWDQLLGDMQFIPSLSEDMNATVGGFVCGDVTYFAAMANVGKSTQLRSEAVNLAKQGKRVLYVSFEENPIQTLAYTYANAFDIRYEYVRNGKEREAVDKARTESDFTQYLHCIRFAKHKDKTHKLDNLLDTELKERNHEYDAVVIDYVTCFAPNDMQLLREPHLAGEEIAASLKEIAQKYMVAIITAAQLNRESLKLKDEEIWDISMAHIGKSHGITENADCMIAMVQTGAMRTTGLVGYKVIKTRTDGANARWYCQYVHEYRKIIPATVKYVEEPPSDFKEDQKKAKPEQKHVKSLR